MKKVIRTGKIRCNYVNIVRPKVNSLSGEEEYSIQLLIPKSNASLVAEINAMIEELARERWGANIPPMMKRPLRDGDAEGKIEAHYKNSYFMNVKSKEAPGIVDVEGNPVTLTPNDITNGDFFRVSIGGFTYDTPPPGGVSFGLNNVQIIAKGESISGRQRAEEEFGPMMDDSTQNAAGGMLD